MSAIRDAVLAYLDTLDGDSILEIDPGPEPVVTGGRFRRRWVQAEEPPEIPGVRVIRGQFPEVRPPQLHDVVAWLDPSADAWPALLAQGLWRVLAGTSSREEAVALAGRNPDAILGDPAGHVVAVFCVGPGPAMLYRPTRTRGSCCG